MPSNRPQYKTCPEITVVDELIELVSLINELIQHFDTDGNEALLQIKKQVSKIQSAKLESRSPDGQMLQRITLAKLELEDLLISAKGVLQHITSKDGNLNFIITILTRLYNSKLKREINYIADEIKQNVTTVLNINPEITAIYRDIACK